MKQLRLLALLLALALVPALPVWAEEEQPRSFLRECVMEQDLVRVYMADPDEKVGMDPERYQVTVAQQEVPVTKLSNLNNSKEGISWYILVDDSGSMGSYQMESAKAFLNVLMTVLSEKDNLVLAAMGTQVRSTDFLEAGSPEIQVFLDSLTGSEAYTSLYDGIFQAVRTLTGDPRANVAKCLIILSDGDDQTTSGRTLKEAQDAIQSAGLPVYSVALLPRSYSAGQLEYAKQLGVLARQSVGGEACIPDVDGVSLDDAFDMVYQGIMSTLIMEVDLKGLSLENTGDQVALRVRYSGEDSTSFDESLTVFTEDLRLTIVNGEEVSAPTAPPLSPQKDEKRSQWMIYAIAGGGAFVLLLLVVLVVLFRKKKAPQEPETSQVPMGVTEPVEPIEPTHKNTPVRETAFDLIPNPGPMSEIVLTAIGHEEVSCIFSVRYNHPVKMGSHAEMTMRVSDRLLAPVQCEIEVTQNGVIMEDSGEGSPVSVNGVPIRGLGRVPIKNGDLVRLGSYEYRLKQEKW